MSYQQVGGLYQVPLVDFGRALEKQGWRVREHSAFGGVTPGVHTPKGHHPHDEALDITWWKSDTDPSGKMGWKDYTKNLGEQLAQLKGANNSFLQALHPGNDPKHATHAHLGVTGGVLALTPQQMQNFGLSNVSPETAQPSAPVAGQEELAQLVLRQKQQETEEFLADFLGKMTKEKHPMAAAPSIDALGLLKQAFQQQPTFMS